MKIGDLSIIKFLYNSAIEKKKQELEKQGYKVCLEYRFKDVVFDLYAELNSVKYVYEFKISKNTKVDGQNSLNHFKKLQEAARFIGARLFVVYIKYPQEGVNVSFECLGDILSDDLFEKRLSVFSNFNDPSVLNVFNINISFINIEKDSFHVNGSFTADVDYILADTETFKLNPRLDSIENRYFDLLFEIQLNNNFAVLKSEYQFITKY